MNAITGKNDVDVDEGLVCTPSEQTKDIKSFASLDKTQIELLGENNLYTKRGRRFFYKKYNKYFGIDIEWWTEENENNLERKHKDDELGFYFSFVEFQRKFSKQCSLMASMNEGNHRVQCISYTAAGRKVHKLVRLEASHPDEKSLLSKEYLMKGGDGINDNFLFTEGRTTVTESIGRVMRNDDELMVDVYFSIPTKENNATHPLSNLLDHWKKESRDFAEDKKNSSDRSDFKEVAASLKQAYMTTGQTESSELLTIGRSFKLTVNGEEKKIYTKPSEEGEEGAARWAKTILRFVNADTINTLRVKVDGKYEGYPLLPETLKQLRLAAKTKVKWSTDNTPVDHVEINLMHLGTQWLYYCIKHHGGAGDDFIHEIAKAFLTGRRYNLSIKRKTGKDFLVSLGDDTYKGVAAAFYVQCMYLTGAMFNRKNEVVSSIGNIGIASLVQDKNWNYMSKSSHCILKFLI